MKRYHLRILTANGTYEKVVEADSINSSLTNSYVFQNLIKGKNITHFDLVACYPVNSTIIEKIEEII